MQKTAILIGLLLLTAGSFAQSVAADTSKVDKSEMKSGVKPRKEKGYYFVMQASFLFGNKQETDMTSYYPSYYPYNPSSYIAPLPSFYSPYTRTTMAVSPSFTITNGYMFNKHWAAGAGVGFEIFDHNYFPLFAELRYTLWDNKISPFVVIKGGYSFCSFGARNYDDLYLNWYPYYITDASLRHYGGVMVHPELGVKVPLSENSDLLFTVAYRYQKSKSVARVDYGNAQFVEWEHNEEINRLSFGIAIMFR
jgi:hypothetical protein